MCLMQLEHLSVILTNFPEKRCPKQMILKKSSNLVLRSDWKLLRIFVNLHRSLRKFADHRESLLIFALILVNFHRLCELSQIFVVSRDCSLIKAYPQRLSQTILIFCKSSIFFIDLSRSLQTFTDSRRPFQISAFISKYYSVYIFEWYTWIILILTIYYIIRILENGEQIITLENV